MPVKALEFDNVGIKVALEKLKYSIDFVELNAFKPILYIYGGKTIFFSA